MIHGTRPTKSLNITGRVETINAPERGETGAFTEKVTYGKNRPVSSAI